MSNNQLLYIIESDDFSINELNFNGIDMTDPALQGYIDGVYAKSALLMEADQEGVVSHEYLEVIANSQLDAAASEKMIAYCAAYPEIGVDELTEKVQSEVTLNEEIQRLEAEEQAEPVDAHIPDISSHKSKLSPSINSNPILTLPARRSVL